MPPERHRGGHWAQDVDALPVDRGTPDSGRSVGGFEGVERSFLGASNALECAATLEEDCRASTRCTTHGLCAREKVYDVGCSAATVSMCTASTRCATHDECELFEHE